MVEQMDKLAEYEAAGVRVYTLREGRYTDPHTYAVSDHARSAAIEGFSVPVEDVL